MVDDAINFESWVARSKSSSLLLLIPAAAAAFLIRETRLWFDAGGKLLADLLRFMIVLPSGFWPAQGRFEQTGNGFWRAPRRLAPMCQDSALNRGVGLRGEGWNQGVRIVR